MIVREDKLRIPRKKKKQKGTRIDEDYEKWLDKFINEPSENELEKMSNPFERDSLNNSNYQPIKGA